MAHLGSLSRWYVFALFGAALALASCDRPDAAEPVGGKPPAFQTSDVYPEDSNARPWTHLNFLDDPDDFQFAIITDRTGGARPGVFEGILAKVNLLQPEFVMSVGDYIEGYVRDADKVRAEWAEIDGMVKALEPPLFFVVGNHEVFDADSEAVWRERTGGVTWYHFLYRDTLFIALNTEDSRHPTPEEIVQLDKALALYAQSPAAAAEFMKGNEIIRTYIGETDAQRIGDAQTQWVLDLLERHKNVRWTFFFMHRPVWQQGIANFERIEAALSGRGYTMFAGHIHSHSWEQRNGRDYVGLGTSGGGWSPAGGPGEMDHVTWVTMRKEGPIFAHLLATGILAKDGVPDFAPGAEFCGPQYNIPCISKPRP